MASDTTTLRAVQDFSALVVDALMNNDTGRLGELEAIAAANGLLSLLEPSHVAQMSQARLMARRPIPAAPTAQPSAAAATNEKNISDMIKRRNNDAASTPKKNEDDHMASKEFESLSKRLDAIEQGKSKEGDKNEATTREELVTKHKAVLNDAKASPDAKKLAREVLSILGEADDSEEARMRASIDKRMGLSAEATGIVETPVYGGGVSVSFDMSPAQARARLIEIEAQRAARGAR